jgi:hypothetical protein
MIDVSIWLVMGLLLLLGNVIVEMDESGDVETHLSEEAGPE